jgi:hypothetical protein
LRVRNGDGENAVQLNATVTNLFSNDENASNGLVKAWAQINGDGAIVACWRCNTDPSETRRIGEGQYEVDFTPLATDITGRPRLATFDTHVSVVNGLRGGAVHLGDLDDDASLVFVVTTDSAGADADRSVVLMIY